MKESMISTALLLALLLLTSGCTPKLKYMPTPTFPRLSEPPKLDLNGTGEMERLSHDKWAVSHKLVLEVIRYDKSCQELEADYIGSIEGHNAYNKYLEDLN